MGLYIVPCICCSSMEHVFEEAVGKLGLEKAVPKTIMQVR
jgi:hypothetical protein